MPTYKQLLAEKEALEAKLSEVRANEVSGVAAQIRQLMADYDLTADDIAPKRRRGRPAGSGAGAARKTASAAPEIPGPENRQDLVWPWPRPGMAGQAPLSAS